MEEAPHGEQFVPPEVFDEDYDYFYGHRLRPERSKHEADFVRRLAELRPEQAVLDVPCGDGRIAVPLAEAGCTVVGIDQNERLIDRAHEHGTSAARFDVGDMRELRWKEEFDCVINWFGSFGYFDSDTNRAVLRGFCEALRPGGKLVLDQINPEQVRRDIEIGHGSAVQMVDRGLDLMVDRVRISEGRSHTERFLVRNGRVRKVAFSLDLIDDEALDRWLHEAGFESVRLVDQQGDPFTSDSRRRIAVAQRRR